LKRFKLEIFQILKNLEKIDSAKLKNWRKETEAVRTMRSRRNQPKTEKIGKLLYASNSQPPRWVGREHKKCGQAALTRANARQIGFAQHTSFT
jgi:hypothetical protein